MRLGSQANGKSPSKMVDQKWLNLAVFPPVSKFKTWKGPIGPKSSTQHGTKVKSHFELTLGLPRISITKLTLDRKFQPSRKKVQVESHQPS